MTTAATPFNPREPGTFLYRDAEEFLRSGDREGPTLLFSETALDHRVRQFFEHFPGATAYAVKANAEPRVLGALWRSGIREFDAASIGEVRALRRLLPAAHINFNNPVRPRADTLAACAEFGVSSFVVDDAAGLEALEALANRNLEITVRFTLPHSDAAYDFGSKFGATPAAAAELLQRAARLSDRVSLTFHPGSQCTSPAVYDNYIRAAADICSGVRIALYRLNVGGGFPLPYPGARAPSLAAYFEAIGKAARVHFAGSPPRLICEPGRALVGPSCSLLTQVIHVRDNGAVFVDDGLYGSLQEQLLMDCALPLRLWRDGRRLPVNGPLRSVFGPTCDPTDRLARDYRLNRDIAPGDLVEFGLVGAYGSATSTRFNGILPARYVSVQAGFQLD